MIGSRADYARPGRLTELSRHAERVAALPPHVDALCGVVQGLVVHVFHAERYGLETAKLRHDELQTRSAASMIDRILALDPADLAEARPPERRFVGNCRHFSTLLVALLRAKGVPARARCGFGAYFEREAARFVDHWVAETWDAADGRWKLVDAQIDDVQRSALRVGFDTTDVPRDEFLVAGEAWRRCRGGEADPSKFGILDMWGLWFVRGNLVRDVAALHKVELLPWDGWGLADRDDADLDEKALELLDRAAAVTCEVGATEHAAGIEALWEPEGAFRVEDRFFSYAEGRRQALRLDDVS